MPADREASEESYIEAIKCIEISQAAKDPDVQAAKSAEGQRKLEEALALNPLNHKARFVLAGCAMRTDDFARVKKEGTIIYNAMTEEDRLQMGDAVLYLMLAHACKMLGELENAIRFASEASLLYPQDPHPHMILGELYEVQCNNEEAERQCREALMFHDDPKCKHSLNAQSVYLTLCCLGGALARQSKYTEAERFLKEAMSSPYAEHSPLAARVLVDIYTLQGRFREALHRCERLRDRYPDDEEIRVKLDAMLQVLETSSSDFSRSHRNGGSRRGSDTEGSRRRTERTILNHKQESREDRRRGSDTERSLRGVNADDLLESEAVEAPTRDIAEGGFCCCFGRSNDTGRYEV